MADFSLEKKVNTAQNFNPVYYRILTFFAPCFEVFLHFTINHKIDYQYFATQKVIQTEIFQEFLPFWKIAKRSELPPPEAVASKNRQRRLGNE